MIDQRVMVNLSPEEHARLRELRPDGVSDSAFFRALLRDAGPLTEAPSYDEALALLAESARTGVVSARIALERALRPSEPPQSMDGALSRLLAGD